MFSGNDKFVNFTDPDEIRKHDIRIDPSTGKLIGSPVLRIKIPVKLNVRIPGSYIVHCQIIDEKFGTMIHEWKYWFRLQGSTPEVSEAIMVCRSFDK